MKNCAITFCWGETAAIFCVKHDERWRDSPEMKRSLGFEREPGNDKATAPLARILVVANRKLVAMMDFINRTSAEERNTRVRHQEAEAIGQAVVAGVRADAKRNGVTGRQPC